MPARPSSPRRQQRRPRPRPEAQPVPASARAVAAASVEPSTAVPATAEPPVTRARRAARLAAEHVDYTAEHAIARRDLSRIALLSVVLVIAMLALWLSGVV
ncbi:MAG: hypothetical protein KGS47_16675 [Chloroflexi bacterium]|nr:hypothetical protein [Chloroflexota bacterium]